MKRFLTLFLMILLATIIAFILASCDEQEHVHTEQTLEAVAPTCTETGLTEGKKCSECNEILLSQETIEAVGHIEKLLESVEPTCIEEGLAERKICSVCGEMLAQEIVPSFGGHTIENGYTCVVCGETLTPSEGLEFVLSDDSTYYIVASVGNCIDTDIVIPYDYQGLPVKVIGENAFKDCGLIESVSIPNSITALGDNSFYGCESLSSMFIPNSVTTMGDSLFEACTNLTNITIGSGVTAIGGLAFRLTDLTVVNYLGTIGDWCNIYFAYHHSNPMCYAEEVYINGELLTELLIPDTVTEIKDYAFYKFDDITSVEIPNSVITIGYCAFCECTSLTSIEIGKGVTFIDNAAFNCVDFTKVNYLGDVADWCNISFNDISSNPMCCAEKFSINGEMLTEIVIPETVTELKNYTFYSCPFEKVYISKNIKDIALYTFGGKIGIKRFEIDENNKYFSAIDGDLCTKDGTEILRFAIGKTQKDVVLSSKIQKIKNRAFDCNDLKSIVIPNSVTIIEEYSFLNSSCIESITLPSVGGHMGSDDIPRLGAMFTYRNGTIERAAPRTLRKVVINGGYVNDYAFYGLENITTVVICEGTTSIGREAFYRCKSLTSVTLPSTLDSIYSYAFAECASLQDIKIPDSVTYIGGGAFRRTPAAKKTGGAYYVGKWLVLAEENTTTAKIKEGTIGIAENAFFPDAIGQMPLKSVEIPNGVKYICDSAFENCVMLESIYLPNSIEYIGYSAFENCDLLTIYCEAQSKPSGLDSSWIASHHVVWGHTHTYESGSCVCGKVE